MEKKGTAQKSIIKEGTPISSPKEVIKETIQEQTKPIIKESTTENVLYMDSYTSLKNLCDWDIYFALTQGGDKTIKAKGTLDILNRDIVSLCNNNDIFFVGEDGQGSHARIKIMNPQLRSHVGFENEDRKQVLLDDEKLEEIFSSKTKKQFEDAIHENIVAYHEKDIVIEYAKKIRENSYDRITFLEAFTGRNFRE